MRTEWMCMRESLPEPDRAKCWAQTSRLQNCEQRNTEATQSMELCHSCSSDLTLPWTDLLTARVSQGMETASRYFLPQGLWGSQQMIPGKCTAVLLKRTGWEHQGGSCYGQTGVAQGSLGKALCCQGWDRVPPGKDGREGEARLPAPHPPPALVSWACIWSHFPLQSPACCDSQSSIPKPNCYGAWIHGWV